MVAGQSLEALTTSAYTGAAVWLEFFHNSKLPQQSRHRHISQAKKKRFVSGFPTDSIFSSRPYDFFSIFNKITANSNRKAFLNDRKPCARG